MKKWFVLFAGVLSLFLWATVVWAVNNEDCLECHEGEKLSIQQCQLDPRGTGFYPKVEGNQDIDATLFKKSAHKNKKCTDCHSDASLDHSDRDDPSLKQVNCAKCHKQEGKLYKGSVHDNARHKKIGQFTPSCTACHGNHYIMSAKTCDKSTNMMNIPQICGRCHKEGKAMVVDKDLSHKHVVENYSMSIHGKGLFKRGLTVVPVCTTCHGTHDILSHKKGKSNISRKNIAKTCMQCHGNIQIVHRKMVQGHLWQQEPNKIPVCIECHQPHKLRQIVYDKSITDTQCLDCHNNPKLKEIKGGDKLYMDASQFDASIHHEQPCVKCHFDTHPKNDRICKDPKAFGKYIDLLAAGKTDSKLPVCKKLKPVDCSACHEGVVKAYDTGIHGQLLARSDPDAPKCVFCHTKHNIKSKNDPTSPTYALRVPDLCGKCHKEGAKAAIRLGSTETHIYRNFETSIHGKGSVESGLIVTATCPRCHTPHMELPAKDPRSTVNKDNLPNTCAKCHFGIEKTFKESVHSKNVTKTEKKLPVCNDCHSSHSISRVAQSDFRLGIIKECGECHEKLTVSYFDSYHGKASKLGGVGAAKCYDCHGSHNIMPKSDPKSPLHANNIVQTCRKCHPNANQRFTQYMPHASHHEPEKYPILFYTFWAMTGLLVGTFGLFGLHTILWLIRILLDHGKHGGHKEIDPNEPWVKRFIKVHSVTHILIIISFLTLALTGMTLKFSGGEFFMLVTKIFGGPEVLGALHRIAAVITFFYFSMHLVVVSGKLLQGQITVKGLLTEEYSMVPLLRDLKELKQNMLYFIGKAEKPEFGRWTYWEKFDYMAVFWGVAVIGLTGLVLWFPETATVLLPGWFINVATVIHSDEALLATGFIFTIHFFNTHLRPGKFPMDQVVFTGRMPLSEFKEERPREYQELMKTGEMDKYLVDPPPKWFSSWVKVFGLSALTIGLVLVVAIMYALVFVH